MLTAGAPSGLLYRGTECIASYQAIRRPRIAWEMEVERMERKAKFFIILPMVFIAWLIFDSAQSYSDLTPLRIVGLIIAILNFTVLTIARLQLGNSFSLTPQAMKLVTHGLYARIRNPIYVFSAIGIVGLFLYLNKPYLLLILLSVIPLQLYRAHAEAHVLEQRFGEEYRRYKATTWF